MISLLGLITSVALGSGPAADKIAFCQKHADRLYIKVAATESSNHMAFANKGGIFNSGVCWWHSLLQRSSLYLATFRPGLPKPNEKQVMGMLNGFKSLNKIVVIPGYSDFATFTAEWEPVIQKFLNLWQVEDGIVFQEWIGNISSSPWLPAPLMRFEMEKIYDTVMNENKMAWVMIKFPGFPSHSWNVFDIDRDEAGMTLKLLDSNHPGEVREERYKYGSSFVVTKDFGQGLPYLRRTLDMGRIDRTLKNYCKF